MAKRPDLLLYIASLYLLQIIALPVLASQPSELYQQRLDVQVRFDNRSDRPDRYQYRVRYYPQINMTNQWSLHSFVVTGDDFSSSHNTFGEQDSEQLAIRRLYVRRINPSGKTEFGVIPTYKGRVSATGMSKDGWFQGIRHVYQPNSDQQFEIVAGAINDTNPDRALSLSNKLNLLELEYTARLNDVYSMEFGLERITGGNYVRGELRVQQSVNHVWFFELIHRADEADNKVVIGLDGTLSLASYPVDLYAYYAYVSAGFGLRAELTEDYLGTGHGGSVEVSGALPGTAIGWFSRVDMVDSTKRFLLGVKYAF
ncbi:hypothetical protein [Alteromonas gilva]|uniref:Porin n=1 Tax=Alteromonas gilva TaxID=2987522 RepID=A0ABT5KXB2_9ALTE|nr:hypothetical protein [Alteromonas gilva]MDC8829409.1 hypothetical protein [Alteromonas gilva]